MLLHCFESDRPARRWSAAPACWSAGTHGALALTAAAGLGADLAGPRLPDERPPAERVVYVLPALPALAQPAAAPEVVHLRLRGAGGERPPETGAAAREAAAGAPHLPVPDDARAPSTPVADSGSTAGSPVYRVGDQLDQEVERDAASAGPVYPDSLRAAGVEGLVVAEFVVDTTGTVDRTAVRLTHATHPGFAAAVQAALPGMLFRPARLDGRPVRQWVRQEFRFAIVRPVGLVPSSSGAAPRV